MYIYTYLHTYTHIYTHTYIEEPAVVTIQGVL